MIDAIGLEREAFEREATDALAFMIRHYDQGVSWMLEPSRTLEPLGEVLQIQKCRFCGKREPEVRFRTAAHAISELLGNKTLFVRYECDKCNQKFGGSIENHLGNWSKPLRTMCHIDGKRGVPVIKSRDKEARFAVENGTMHVVHGRDHDSFVVDEVEKSVTMVLPRDAYKPLSVLKALTKSALNLIPEDRICFFTETIAWVNDVDGTDALIPNQKVAFQYLPGPTTSKTILASLFFRLSDCDFVPYCSFLLAFGNAGIHLVIPAPSKDWHLGKKNIEMPFFPMQTFDNASAYGSSVRLADDMSSPKIVKNSALKILFKYAERRSLEV